MTRPIKIRTWIPEEWKFYNLSINWNENTNENFGIDGMEMHYPEKEGYIFQQFTGVLDKSGKEIYEGDIVLNHTSYEEYCSPAVIVWGAYEEAGWYLAFALTHPKQGKIPPKLLHRISGLPDLMQEFPLKYKPYGTYEVIGNILENSDFLQ